MNRRRTALAALGCAALWPLRAAAQAQDKPRSIAFRMAGATPRAGQFSTVEAVIEGLRGRGHDAVQSSARYAEGHGDALQLRRAGRAAGLCQRPGRDRAADGRHHRPPPARRVARNTRFDLLLNLRTARALGLAVPGTLLKRATEVLE